MANVSNKKLSFLIETHVTKAIRDMKEFERSLKRVKQASLGMRALKNVFGPLGAAVRGAFALNAVRNAADAYTDITSKVRLYAKSESEVIRIREELFRVSNETNTSVKATAQLYSRLSLSQKELGASNQQVIKFTELVGKSLAVSGTDAVSAQGAIIQLSQAMGEGIVRTQEFNSILENAPYLLQVVAQRIAGAGGMVAGLRKVMKDGKLTSKDFFDALLEGGGEVDEQFSKVGVTTSKAITKLKNSFVKFVGALEDRLGIIDKLAKLLTKAAGAFNLLSKSQDDVEVDNIRKQREEIQKLNEELKTVKTADRRKHLQGQIEQKQGFLNRQRTNLTKALGLNAVDDKNLLGEAIKIQETNSTHKERIEDALKKLAPKIQAGSSLSTVPVEDDYSRNKELYEKYKEYLTKGGDFDFTPENIKILDKVVDGVEELPKIALNKINENLQNVNKLISAVEPLSASSSSTGNVVAGGNAGGNKGSGNGNDDEDKEKEEELERIRELAKETLAYPETALEKNKRILLDFIEKYKNHGGEYKEVIEDAHLAIEKLDDGINEEKLKKKSDEAKKRAEEIVSIAQKTADSIKSIFSVIADGIGTLFSNQLLELERFYQKQTELLEQETEAEEFHKELKQEREAEEFENKFAIKQEEFYQLSQAEQEAYINTLASKADREELANLAAVRSREDRDKQIAKLEEEKANKEKAIKAKQFELDKGSKITQAIINQALAIVSAWATGGILAPVFAGIASAITGAQIGIIASQKNPYAYREGGIALAPQVARLAEAGPELVLNAELTKHIRDSFSSREETPTPNVTNHINIETNDPIAVAEELKSRLGIDL